MGVAEYPRHSDKMRTYDDSFSGERIYPGKGKIYVRGDSKVFRFQNGKSESLFLQRKNPRRIAWTVLYRRQALCRCPQVRGFCAERREWMQNSWESAVLVFSGRFLYDMGAWNGTGCIGS